MVHSFEEIIKQDENIYGGMYPMYVKDVDGELIENSVSIVKERAGSIVKFLDLEISKSTLLQKFLLREITYYKNYTGSKKPKRS